MHIFLVDAFTNSVFCGNPAGVCFVEQFPNDLEMQKIAAYYCWSEIAFLRQRSNNLFDIRWFSPLDEAPLCGHATLAAAHVLFSKNMITDNTAYFVNKTWTTKVVCNQDKTITIFFPAKPITKISEHNFMVKNLIGIEKYVEILKDDFVYIIVLQNAIDVLNAVPNFAEIKKIKTRAIGITARATNEFDFCSRYFAPIVGINEDPVCGSLHCRLGLYWSKILSKKQLIAKQLSRRTGILNLVVGDDIIYITGKAVVVGEIW